MRQECGTRIVITEQAVAKCLKKLIAGPGVGQYLFK